MKLPWLLLTQITDTAVPVLALSTPENTHNLWPFILLIANAGMAVTKVTIKVWGGMRGSVHLTQAWIGMAD